MLSLNLIKNVSKFYSVNLFKQYSSALYITGDKAHDTFAVLNPHLDFDERLDNKPELENNLKHRGIEINLNELIRIWNFYKHVESKKNNLEDSRTSISQTIKNLSKRSGNHSEKINTLMAHGKMVKEDLKTLREEFWSIEEKIAARVLSLPNILHCKTPVDNLNVIHSFLNPPISSKKSHTEIGKTLDLIDFVNNSFYLKNDAALFEFNLTSYLTDKLNENYTLFSNSDFARSVIVEGCGVDFSNPSLVFTINEEEKQENSRLHVTGSSSFVSFMAYFCKHNVFGTQFPLKYFSVGKKYQPSAENSSLLTISQETTIGVFVATKNYQEMDSEFEKVFQNFVELYSSLNWHFRVCLIPAKNLENWESLRASFQLFSPFLNDYIEVGNISLCGDYISKRLLFNYGKGYNVNYPCIITGSLISVPKLLSCVLESEEYMKNGLLPVFLNKD